MASCTEKKNWILHVCITTLPRVWVFGEHDTWHWYNSGSFVQPRQNVYHVTEYPVFERLLQAFKGGDWHVACRIGIPWRCRKETRLYSVCVSVSICLSAILRYKTILSYKLDYFRIHLSRMRSTQEVCTTLDRHKWCIRRVDEQFNLALRVGYRVNNIFSSLYRQAPTLAKNQLPTEETEQGRWEARTHMQP